VEDHLAPSRGRRDGILVPKIPLDEPHAIGATEILARAIGQIVETNDLMTVCTQTRCQVRADEPGHARYECPHLLSFEGAPS
jgi:hypothetical protein